MPESPEISARSEESIILRLRHLQFSDILGRMRLACLFLFTILAQFGYADLISLDDWFKRTWRDSPVPPPDARDVTWSPWEDRVPLPRQSVQWMADGMPLELPVVFPGDNQFVIRVPDQWQDFDHLTAELVLPNDLPANSQVYLFVKDWDILWYQHRLDWNPVNTAVPQTFSVPISGRAARTAWKPNGHQRPWHQLTPGQVLEFGVQINSNPGDSTNVATSAYLLSAGLTKADSSEDADLPPAVQGLRILTEKPTVGSKVEIGFSTTIPLKRPFSREDVSVTAKVSGPQGITDDVHAFYYEDFLADISDPQGTLTPWGEPELRIRYMPRVPGVYHVQISGTITGHPLHLPLLKFEVSPAWKPWKGFVTVSPDDTRRLEFSEDASVFNARGLNVRSPFDTRYITSFPFSDWAYEDMNIYERLLPKYQAAGINVLEVWLSSWWLALEWIPNAIGNHGVGHMNQWRSWKLDRLLDMAEAHDIYIILVINNHGKFSGWVDVEWPDNPFNKANGGPLNSPREYFHRDVAKKAVREFVEYATARWGYSSNLLAWKLFSEIDLTGEKSDGGRRWYRNQAVTDWHREIGDYFKKVDPNPHLVTTHWATNYSIVNEPLARLPQLDMLTVDAYYDRNEGAGRLFELVSETIAFAQTMKKPVAITEYGGNPWGDTIGHILNEHHLGLWRGYFGNMGITPFFWWFPLVEEYDLYYEYRAMANFSDGDDTRNARCTSVDEYTDSLGMCRMATDRANWFWLYDRSFYFSGNLSMPAAVHRDITIDVQGLETGEYRIEFWDCRQGIITKQEPLTIKIAGHVSRVQLPAFRRDIAIKVVEQR